MSEASLPPNVSVANLPQLPQSSTALKLWVGLLLIVGGYAPMLYVHGQSLWTRDHYQFFPLLLVGSALLFVSRRHCLQPLNRNGPRGRNWGMRLNSVALATSFFVFVLGVAINSRLAVTASAILTLGCLLHRAFGWRQSGEWLPPWMLLWLVVPPPSGLDYQLITWLQRQTASAASLCLDVLGYDHLMTGVILEVPNAKFFVDEACSGVHSLVALLAATCLYVVWGRRPTLSTIVLLISAMCWAGFGNILRIVTITVAHEQWDVDLTSGWQHDALGMATFAIAFCLLMSTDRLLFAFLSPVHPEEDEASRTGQLWNRWIASPWLPSVHRRDSDDFAGESGTGAGDDAAVSVRHTNGSRFRFSRFCWGFAIGVAVLGGLQFAVQASSPGFGGTDARSYLALYEKMDSDVLPGTEEQWKWVNYDVEHRDWDNLLGRCSQVWQYSCPYGAAHVALDYPFVGDHDLSICYSNQGWEVVGRTRHTAEIDGVASPYVEVRLHKHTGEHGLLLYTLFNTEGDSVTRGQETLWTRMLNRLEGSPLFNLAESKGLWKKMERVESYQFQLFIPADSPLSEEQRTMTRERYVELRKNIIREFKAVRDNVTRINPDS